MKIFMVSVRSAVAYERVMTTGRSLFDFACAYSTISVSNLGGPAFARQRRKAGPGRYAAAFDLPFKKASRSALIVSASVVGMPCGKPL